jgi:hypothetical protein
MPVTALGKASWFLLSCGALVIPGLATPPVHCAEREVRVFQVKVGSRPAGEYTLIMTRQDDGSIMVHADARVTVSYLIYSYKYRYHGTETWRSDRLTQMDSWANDNGTKYKVQAAAEGQSLHVWTNNRNEVIRGDVWTTTYWKLPSAQLRNQQVPLLDADTGQELLGTLEFVETKAVTIAGQALQCSHYHVTADRPNGGARLDVHLWYDPQERLVWEDSIEEGRHVTFELNRIGQ